MRKLKHCVACNSTDIYQTLYLEPTPLANDFQDEPQEETAKFPLGLSRCKNCLHLQLTYTVPEELLFEKEYPYVSGTSVIFRRHFEEYAKSVSADLFVPSRILDIGSNDGTLLAEFQKLGHETLGIDPAKNVCDIARANNIETINDFFSADVVPGTFDVITCNNCFAHTTKVREITQDVVKKLNPNGKFIIEFVPEQMTMKNWDNIYHEHVSYWSIGSLAKMFKEFGLTITDIKIVKSHGGSYRVTAQTGDVPEYDLGRYLKVLVLCVSLLGSRWLDLDIEEQPYLNPHFEPPPVAMHLGLGAPARMTTYIYQTSTGADFRLPNFVIDDSPLKQGKFSPGKNIPVVSLQEGKNKIEELMSFRDEEPLNAICYAWQFAPSMIEKLYPQILNNKVKVYIPKLENNTFTIVSKDNLNSYLEAHGDEMALGAFL